MNIKIIDGMPNLNQNDIKHLLPKTFDKSSISEINEIKPLNKNDFVRKRCYRLVLNNSEAIHLTCGSDLKNVFEKTKSFNEALPEFTCKPLFLTTKGKYHLFGQEYFAGSPIDELPLRTKISEKKISFLVKKIKDLLASLEKESTHQLLRDEFHRFYKKITENSLIRKTDRYLLENEILPYFEDEIKGISPTIRWSSGDLAAKNILVNPEMSFRIIDCEFAHQTHFHNEDWVRLANFSKTAFAELKCFQKIFKEIPSIISLYFYLRQTYLNKNIHLGKSYLNYLQHDLIKSLKIAYHSPKVGNLTINGVLSNFKLLKNQLHESKIDLLESNSNFNKSYQKLCNEKEIIEEQFKQLEEAHKKTNSELVQIGVKCKRINEQNITIISKHQKICDHNLRLQKLLDKEKSIVSSLKFEIDLKTDKILRMKNSFSWKISSPLRFLRRKYLDSRSLLRTETHHTNWVRSHEKNNRLDDQHNEKTLKYRPLISLIMPVFNTPKEFLVEAIESVQKQTYYNFELCIADDNSDSKIIKEILKKYVNSDSRIKVVYRKKTGNISKATISAISIASGDYIGFLDHDDVLNPSALMSVVAALNCNKDLKLIYSDEDKIAPDGKRISPYFKPDWNYNLFLSQNYLCHFVVLEKQTFDKHGCFRSECDGAQDWDNLLHIISKIKDKQILHIPKILYHWRIHENSTASNVSAKPNVIKSSLKALNDFCCRENIDAHVEVVEECYFYVSQQLPIPRPLVTIIIPTRNNYFILKRCIESIFLNTDYQNYKIIIVNNSSDEPETLNYLDSLENNDNIQIQNYDKSFNHSAINNLSVDRNDSELYLFLNDDTEMIQPDWLTKMVGSIQQNDIGIVGCKLLYPNRKVQHAGVVLGIGDFAGHAYRHLRENEPVMGARINLKQNYTAVTAACMLIKSEVFMAVNGFDAVNLPTSYNDVDLCLRVAQRKYKILYEPVTAIHHESVTRGKPTSKKQIIDEENAVKYMKSKWKKIYIKDPNYNPNLTRVLENFSY